MPRIAKTYSNCGHRERCPLWRNHGTTVARLSWLCVSTRTARLGPRIRGRRRAGAVSRPALGAEAKSWELRATMSLCRLWQEQGKREEAHQMLAGIYGWFTEGFDTPDLREAKALLEEISHR